jgi:hypothetical protein
MRPCGPPRVALVTAPNSPGGTVVARPEANAPWPLLFAAPMQLAWGAGWLVSANATPLMPSVRAAHIPNINSWLLTDRKQTKRLQHVANLPSCLFRVGQTRGRRKRQPVLFDIGERDDYRFEPGLPKALAALSQRQRLAVVLVHGYGYTLREVADLTGTRPTTVQNHLSLPGAADDLARMVYKKVKPLQLSLPSLADECPEWEWYEKS